MPSKRTFAIVLAAVGVLYAALMGGCALPPLDGREASSALSQQEARATALGKAISPLADTHAGLSGIHPLADARDAFAARMSLVRAAERTLDVQYYIWRADMTGTLLLEALYEAADRGVRVRLLLDDNGIAGLDDELAALDAHANIQVRLFNPFLLRWPKMLGYFTDFSRLNRRMHNKSLTADNQVTIIGGRNIGDEYFGASDGVLFSDLDVLAVGKVVDDVSEDFDLYWQSDSSYPVELILAPAEPGWREALRESAAGIEGSEAAEQYISVLKEATFVKRLRQGQLPLEWAVTRMVSDDPAKGLGQAPPESMLPHQLDEILGAPKHRLELVSPYFVPTESGTQSLVNMVQRGVQVRVLTNALEATDVIIVHSGYAKRREDLLRGGVQLYEMRSAASTPQPQGSRLLGSSGSSLHAKTFAVDGERVFVGSFNFDPRSAKLNTELGFVIDSPALARQVTRIFSQDVPRMAYRLGLDEDGEIYWLFHKDDQEQRFDVEPGTNWWQRATIKFLQLLPIDPLL